MDFNSCRFVSYLVFAVSRKIFLILVIYQILWSQIWIKVAFLFKVDIRKTPENYNFFLPFSLELQISIGLKRWGNFFTLKIMMITSVCFFFRFEYRRKHFVVATVAAVVLVALVALGIGIGYRSSKQVKLVKQAKLLNT